MSAGKTTPAKKTTKKPVKSKAATGFTAEERAAMKERTKELKDAARKIATREDGEAAIKEKIGELKEPERSMAKKLHAIITATAPDLMPRLWYGMPAYAKDDKVLCFYQSATKFNTRYSTLGFSDVAKLDDGEMWPAAYALTKITPAEEKKIIALVKIAVG